MRTDDSSRADDAEILSRVIPGAGSWALASRLIREFGGLRRVLHADGDLLAGIPGVGPARARLIASLPCLARRYFEQSLVLGEPLRSPADTEAYLLARLCHLDHELFCCLYLDNRHRVLGFQELFRGTIDGTSVYPREVVKEALAINAAAVIVAHNHPSGVAEPSQADERITQRLKAALELVDIRLLDHLVVGDTKAVSLAARGLL
jgi:DNA repair protein RadC